MKPKISVIVPVYNVEKYLHKCVETIIHQTFKELEIILVDDGSTDQSKAICDELAALDKRILVIHQANKGLSEARNIGLSVAQGDYIGFVDSDDYIDTDFYEFLYKNCIKHRAEIAICDYYIVENEKVIRNEIEGEFVSFHKQDALYALAENKMFKNHAWSKLYHRNVFEKIRFPKGKYYEDVFIMYQLFLETEKIIYINEPKYYYVQRSDSIVKKTAALGKLDHIEASINAYNIVSKTLPSLENAFYIALQKAYKEFMKMIASQSYYWFIKNQKQLLKFRIELSALQSKRRTKHRLYKLMVFHPYITIALFKLYLTIRKSDFLKKCKFSLQHFQLIMKHESVLLKDKNLVFIGYPEYGNMGDHAIALSSQALIKEHIQADDNLIILSEHQFLKSLHYLRKKLTSNDRIFLQGGGNMGDQYKNQEYLRRKCLKAFRKTPIYIFPQTIYMNNKSAYNDYFKDYLDHPNCYVFAREQTSFEIFQHYLKASNSILVPDIVLSYHPKIPPQVRNGVMLCIRSDVEGIMNAETYYKIKQSVLSIYHYVKISDTVRKKVISINESKAVIHAKLKEFSQCELIITDRLHGMIFAAITKTPCIVFSNYNYKVSGVYQWISNLSYIKHVQDYEGFESALQMLREQINESEPSELNRAFEPLIKRIRGDIL